MLPTRDLLATLRERGQTVATAESLTGGLLCARLTAVPGASDVVRGGIVAYATDVKRDVLGVDPSILRYDGAVSERTAAAMAAGVRRLFGSTWGIATTGVAGPTDQEGKPVGTVFVAVSGPIQLVRELRLTGDREGIRRKTCQEAVLLLHECVE